MTATLQRIQPQASSHVASYNRHMARMHCELGYVIGQRSASKSNARLVRLHNEKAFGYARDAIREDRAAEQTFRIVG